MMKEIPLHYKKSFKPQKQVIKLKINLVTLTYIILTIGLFLRQEYLLRDMVSYIAALQMIAN